MPALEDPAADDNVEFTMLWIELLEQHGAAMDFVDQLQKNVEVNDENQRKPVDDTWKENRKNGYVQHEEAVCGLRDAMKAVSDMLSGAEEIIRQHILRSPQPAETTPKTCTCHKNGVRTAAPTALVSARNSVDKATMTTTDLDLPPTSHNLKKSKHRKGDTKSTRNSLVDYLDGAMLGDDDPAFVDAVRGWDAPPAKSVAASTSKPPDRFVLDGPELHDVMMKNNIRFANLQMHLQAQAQAQAHSEVQAQAQAQSQAQQHHTRQTASPAAPRAYRGSSTPSSSATTGKHKAAKVLATDGTGKKAKKRKLTISTCPTSSPSVMSPPANASRRLVRETVANLTAERVLQIRDFSSVCEYLIEWKELVEPIWVQRRQCAPQGKEVIDKFNKIRLQQARRATRERAAVGRITKGTSETTETAEGDVYIVDRIVGHHGQRTKKQYLVKWDGYDSSENTWEAASKLQREVPEIVDEYEKRVAIPVNTQQQEQEGVAEGTEAVAKREPVNKTLYVGAKKKPRHSVASLKSKRRGYAPEENQELVDTDDDVEIMSEDPSDQCPSDEDGRSTLDLENEVVVVNGSDSEDDLIDVKSM